MIPDTASPTEIFFFLIGAFCLAVSIWGLITASKDLRIVRARRRGRPGYAILLLLARQQWRNEAIRASKQLLWLAIYGVWLATPPAVRPGLQLLLLVTATGAAVNQILLAFATVLDRLDNLRAIRLARQQLYQE